MWPYGSREGVVPAAEVPPSLSQSLSLGHVCEPRAHRGLEGATSIRWKADTCSLLERTLPSSSRSTKERARGVLPACVAIAVLVGTAAAVMGQDSPRDYPQWRGRSRDGAASAFSEPASWPENLKRMWMEQGDKLCAQFGIDPKLMAYLRKAEEAGR